MSIIITNVTNDHKPTGVNDYVVKINNRVICEFTHDRSYQGLAQCLRDAADAVDAKGERKEEQMDIEEVIALMRETGEFPDVFGR